VGLQNETFNCIHTFRDLNVGDFVLVKPHNPNLVPL
jgi:hypothetical protein